MILAVLADDYSRGDGLAFDGDDLVTFFEASFVGGRGLQRLYRRARYD